MNGLELAEYILRAWPRCQIIFLTGYDNFDYLYRAQKLGTIQYILKNEGYLKRCRNYLSRSATSS